MAESDSHLTSFSYLAYFKYPIILHKKIMKNFVNKVKNTDLQCIMLKYSGRCVGREIIWDTKVVILKFYNKLQLMARRGAVPRPVHFERNHHYLLKCYWFHNEKSSYNSYLIKYCEPPLYNRCFKVIYYSYYIYAYL